MEKYEQLKQIIQQANPEIMELKFGCEVAFKDHIRTVFGQNHGYVSFCEGGHDMPNLTVERLYKILGRPIRLADVFTVIKRMEEYKISFWDGLCEEDGLGSDGLNILRLLAIWNTLDDNLDHQSEETKQFLINLLV